MVRGGENVTSFVVCEMHPSRCFNARAQPLIHPGEERRGHEESEVIIISGHTVSIAPQTEQH